MADPNFQARATLLEFLVNTTAVNLKNQHAMVSGSQQTNLQVANALQAQQTALRSELVNIQKSADTYDREFLDRRANGEGTLGPLAIRGFSTTQDFVLAGFFVSYVLASLSLLIYIVYSSNQKGLMALLVLFMSVVFGVFISLTIIRYA